MIQGVLFDMEGVQVDSEEYICQAAILMFKERGINVSPKDFISFAGKGENQYIGGVANKYKVPVNIEEVKARTYQIYEEIVKGKLKALPGVFTFIEKAKARNLKIAVATSADKVKMLVNLENIGLSEDIFSATVRSLR
jgi:beta-phosphoglucomutase-like phosphatase (HAD superfamily)